MTAKEYFKQAFTIHRLIKAKESRIQDLRDMLEHVGGMGQQIKVQSSPKSDPMAELVATLVDLIVECQMDYARLLTIQREIQQEIERVERADLRLILFERYVNLKTWEDIAISIGYTVRHVTRLHGQALIATKRCPVLSAKKVV